MNATEVQAALDPIEHVKVMTLTPESIVILECSDEVTVEEAQQMKAAMSTYIPGHAVIVVAGARVVVVEP